MTQPAPTPDAPAPGSDVAHLLGALAEAMAGLAQSQRALLDVLSPSTSKAPAPPPPAEPSPSTSAPPALQPSAAAPPEEPGSAAPPAESPADFTVGGDLPGGGTAPGAVVDFSRLSPLQQIALGLRDARPRGAGAAFRAGAD